MQVWFLVSSLFQNQRFETGCSRAMPANRWTGFWRCLIAHMQTDVFSGNLWVFLSLEIGGWCTYWILDNTVPHANFINIDWWAIDLRRVPGTDYSIIPLATRKTQVGSVKLLMTTLLGYISKTWHSSCFVFKSGKYRYSKDRTPWPRKQEPGFRVVYSKMKIQRKLWGLICVKECLSLLLAGAAERMATSWFHEIDPKHCRAFKLNSWKLLRKPRKNLLEIMSRTGLREKSTYTGNVGRVFEWFLRLMPLRATYNFLVQPLL